MFFKLLGSISLFFLFLGCNISLRVYRPFPYEQPFEYIEKYPKISVVVAGENPLKLAEYDGYFFDSEGLQNEYGPLSYLIRKEISIRKERYPKLIERGGRIEVEEFLLHSLDRCSKNRTEIIIKAKVQITGEAEESFEYSDFIESKVTNCYLTGSSLLIFPLLWYVPYNGFRGNREDQLNLLGRNGLEDFFRFLETQSGNTLDFQGKPVMDTQTKSNDSKNSPNKYDANPSKESSHLEKKEKQEIPQKKSSPVDPKIKEILDSL